MHEQCLVSTTPLIRAHTLHQNSRIITHCLSVIIIVTEFAFTCAPYILIDNTIHHYTIMVYSPYSHTNNTIIQPSTNKHPKNHPKKSPNFPHQRDKKEHVVRTESTTTTRTRKNHAEIDYRRQQREPNNRSFRTPLSSPLFILGMRAETGFPLASCSRLRC